MNTKVKDVAVFGTYAKTTAAVLQYVKLYSLLVLPAVEHANHRGGSTNSSKGGFWAGILQGVGGGGKVQVRGNFHIPTSKEENNLDGGGVAPYRPLDPPLNEGV